MEELLDRVDENDNIIGTTTREEAHTLGYAHRVAAIFVFDDQGRLLINLRKKDGNLDHSSAGHVGRGETYNEAAARELKEELGLTAHLEKVGVFYADERVPTRKLQVVHYFGLYETKISKDEINSMTLQKDEVVKIIPMTIQEVAESMIKESMKWTTGSKFTLNFYAKKKGLKIPTIPIR